MSPFYPLEIMSEKHLFNEIPYSFIVSYMCCGGGGGKEGGS